MFGEIIREALVGLVRNRVRAGLSMLGISWGIVSVVMLLAYGEGFNQALIRGFPRALRLTASRSCSRSRPACRPAASARQASASCGWRMPKRSGQLPLIRRGVPNTCRR
jgi:hypothetical protein